MEREPPPVSWTDLLQGAKRNLQLLATFASIFSFIDHLKVSKKKLLLDGQPYDKLQAVLEESMFSLRSRLIAAFGYVAHF